MGKVREEDLSQWSGQEEAERFRIDLEVEPVKLLDWMWKVRERRILENV